MSSFGSLFRLSALLFLGLTCIYQMSLLIVTSMSYYLTATEIWAMNVAHFAKSSTFDQNVLLFKPLFNGILYILSNLNYQNEEYFLLCRFVFSLISIGVLFITFSLAKKSTQSKLIGLIVVFLLLTTTTYFLRSFRVRSDNLAIVFHLLALLFMLSKGPRYTILLKKINLFFIILLETMALLVTPKAIFLNLSAIVFLYFLLPIPTRQKSVIKIKKLFRQQRRLPFLPFWILFFAASFFIYEPALKYFIHTFGIDSTDGVPYMSSQSFYYYRKFASDNKVQFVLIILGTFLLARNTVKNTSPQRRAWLFSSITLWFALLIIPDKLPFYLSSILPLLILPVGLAFNDWFKKSKKHLLSFQLLGFIFALYISFHAIWYTKSMRNQFGNETQVSVIRSLDQFLKNYPNAKYYDSLGILPHFPHLNEYVNYGQEKYLNQMRHNIERVKPEFVFFNDHLLYLGQEFIDFVAANYVDFGQRIFAKSLSQSKLLNSKVVYKDANKDPLQFHEYATRDLATELKKVFADNINEQSPLFFYLESSDLLATKMIYGLKGKKIFDLQNGILYKDLKKYDKIQILTQYGSFKITVFDRQKLKLIYSVFQQFGFDKGA